MTGLKPPRFFFLPVRCEILRLVPVKQKTGANVWLTDGVKTAGI